MKIIKTAARQANLIFLIKTFELDSKVWQNYKPNVCPWLFISNFVRNECWNIIDFGLLEGVFNTLMNVKMH